MIAILALALLPQDLTLGTVDVGGRAVSVTVPSTRGPYDAKTAHATIDGWNFVVGSDGNLGVRYKSDGGWGEVADAYPAAAQKAATATEYRVKVFLLTNTEILEEGRDGVWVERRGTFGSSNIDEIYSALARFKALAEVAAEGGIKVTFDVSVDDDLVFRVSRASTEEYRSTGFSSMDVGRFESTNALLGPDFVHDEIAPRFNNDPFESEDKVYRGPYSSVFVIHPMRTWDVSSYMVDRTPVTSISWSTFTDRKAGEALSIQLFYAWIGHLGAAAKATYHDTGMSGFVPSGSDLPSTPMVYRVPLSADVLRFGNHLVSGAFADAPVSTSEVPVIVFWEAPRGPKVVSLPDGKIAVHATVLEQFTKAHPEAVARGRMSPRNGHRDWVVFEATGVDLANDLAALKLTAPLPAMAIVGAGPEAGEIGLTPFGVGDFAVSTVDGVVNVQENGADRRGYAVLAMAEPGKALFRATAENGIKLRVKSELADTYVLRLVTRSGKVHDVPMYGDLRVPPELGPTTAIYVSGPLRPSSDWSDFAASLAPIAGEDVVEIRLAPPKYAEYYERESSGGAPVQIASVSVGLVTPTAGGVTPISEEIAWLKTVKAPLDAVAVSKLKLILANKNSPSRLQALGVMNFAKYPDLIPEIATATSSSSAGESFLAINALKLQDDDRGWSQIAFTAIRGPLGHNYAFSATALGDKKEDVTLEVLGVALLSRSHHARLAAVKSVNAIDTEQAAIVASTSLSEGDPAATVRLALVGMKRPKSELFARRVLWEAVNDESEWVRATAYITLLDSPFADIREQAQRGVRDGSVAIRLAVLREMTEKPQESYRSALRMAILDPVALVRAAALRAFAEQPGEVKVEEVQNTLADPSPFVKDALALLARKKGLQIPPRP